MRPAPSPAKSRQACSPSSDAGIVAGRAFGTAAAARRNGRDGGGQGRDGVGGGLTPIVCVGETLAEREAGRTASGGRPAVRRGGGAVLASEMPLVALAYEPVWAIGTGTDRDARPRRRRCTHSCGNGWRRAGAAGVRVVWRKRQGGQRRRVVCDAGHRRRTRWRGVVGCEGIFGDCGCLNNSRQFGGKAGAKKMGLLEINAVGGADSDRGDSAVRSRSCCSMAKAPTWARRSAAARRAACSARPARPTSCRGRRRSRRRVFPVEPRLDVSGHDAHEAEGRRCSRA